MGKSFVSTLQCPKCFKRLNGTTSLNRWHNKYLRCRCKRPWCKIQNIIHFPFISYFIISHWIFMIFSLNFLCILFGISLLKGFDRKVAKETLISQGPFENSPSEDSARFPASLLQQIWFSHFLLDWKHHQKILFFNLCFSVAVARRNGENNKNITLKV